MKIYDWKELALLAKENSQYYGDLYRKLNGFHALSQLPVVDQSDFWNANTIRENRLMTSQMMDGIVFKSGGTTGKPKFSIFSRAEWHLFTHIFGEGMSKAGLSEGDRIANLFYAGELYASFNFIMKSIEAAPIPLVQFPISGGADLDSMLRTMDDFQINVIAGVPTTIVNLAERYAEDRSKYPALKVEKILFGGESMYSDQRARLLEILPGVRISSIGYASVDAGLLGYADSTCGPDEHRAFGQATIVEIVDEATSEVIDETERPGKLLITNLTRALMPIIRYPAGDRAMWVDPSSKENPDRKFQIVGRSEEAARVGPVSIYYEDMRSFLSKANLGFQMTAFQLVTRHFDRKDALIVRLVTPSNTASNTTNFNDLALKLIDRFYVERPMFAQAADENIIHPLSIEWATPRDLEINSRTGKLRRVIDQRQ